MATNVFVHNPDDFTIAAASFTIPAGQYAFVSAVCQNTGTMTINGTNSLNSLSTTSSTNTWTLPTGSTVSGAGTFSIQTSLFNS